MDSVQMRLRLHDLPLLCAGAASRASALAADAAAATVGEGLLHSAAGDDDERQRALLTPSLLKAIDEAEARNDVIARSDAGREAALRRRHSLSGFPDLASGCEVGRVSDKSGQHRSRREICFPGNAERRLDRQAEARGGGRQAADRRHIVCQMSRTASRIRVCAACSSTRSTSNARRTGRTAGHRDQSGSGRGSARRASSRARIAARSPCCDADGKSLLEIGDVAQPVFPRSAVKAIQALPLIESGAADAYGFGDSELALACASHSGEPRMSSWRRRCWPRPAWTRRRWNAARIGRSNHDATVALARSGRCADRAAQQLLRQAFRLPLHLPPSRHRRIAAMSRADHPYPGDGARRDGGGDRRAARRRQQRGIDGCSIPTYAVPLKSLALGFARMATGDGLSASSAPRRRSGCLPPAWPSRSSSPAPAAADTRLMQAAPGRIFVKTGAEGVYCAAVPELGLGIALKCDDGAGRAAEVDRSRRCWRSCSKSDEALAARLDELAQAASRQPEGASRSARLRPTDALDQRLTVSSTWLRSTVRCA